MKVFKKWTFVIIFDLILVVSIVLYFAMLRPSSLNAEINGILIDPPREITNFSLIDQHGHPFTKKQLKGHWSILFFGFTRCPAICPATFNALNKMANLLDKNLPPALIPKIVFISVDPENDTFARINKFVNAYNKNYTGARAEISEIMALEKQLSISVPNEKNALNHSTDIIVLNPKAQIRAYFPYPHRPEIMARDYQKISAS